MTTTTEPLITCHFCGRSGFTRRGLRTHWCDHGNPASKSAQITKGEWQMTVDTPPPLRKPPKVPSGPEGIDVHCDNCGHQADYSAFQREGFPENEFHCPQCEHTWQIRSGAIQKIIPTLEGGIVIREKHTAKIERPAVTVPWERMKTDLWYPKDGDIQAARVIYNDRGKKTVRKTFAHEGQEWITWGGSECRVKCTPVTLLRGGPPTPVRYSCENEIVTIRGKQYVCGPEVEFIATRGPAGEAEHCRRLYAFGGMFAAEAGSYNNLLCKWLKEHKPTEMQRLVWETEIAADLPQSQEKMRAFLGEARPGVPRTESKRFNPLTGKTT